MAIDSQASPMQGHVDVAIVGAGPIGIELGVALKRAGLSTQLFDAGAVGHTISWWAPQTRWFSSNERIAIAGVPLLTPDQTKATREQYLTYLRSVATQFKVPIQTWCPVIDVQSLGNGDSGESRFLLRVKPVGGIRTWTAGAVVLAIGGTDHPKSLGVPGADLPHVDGYLRETHRYYGRRVLIVGGRNSAIEAALRLHHAGAHVSLSYRGDALPEDGIKYWLLPEIKGLLASGRIQDLTGTEVIRIDSDAVYLRAIRDGSESVCEVDDVLSLIGYEQDKTLMSRIGVKLDGPTKRPVFDEATMETDVRGVYVAGTAIAGTQTSKYKTFLENCHDHVDRIVGQLTGALPAVRTQAYQGQIASQPES